LRPEANPNKCYIDGRVGTILADIEALGMNLCHYEEVKWKRLRDATRDIFAHQEQEELNKIKQPGN